jgi:hypothetical protein
MILIFILKSTNKLKYKNELTQRAMHWLETDTSRIQARLTTQIRLDGLN